MHLMAESVDTLADRAYRDRGLPALQCELATDDAVEHALSRLGAVITLQRTGDFQAAQDLCASQPPGRAEVLPTWTTNTARENSKQFTLQRQRNRGSGPREAWAEEDADDRVGAGVRRRNTRRPHN